MSVLDASQLLQPVSDEQPCGADLEYDAAFLAMSAAAEAKPEQQMGDSIIPAEDPDWREVKRQATELLERSKDIRILVRLIESLLHVDGMAAFAEGLDLLRGVLAEFWASVHPELDASDNDDPTMRVNALADLAGTSGMLRSLREVPLVKARMAGSFGLRAIDAALGRGPGGDDTVTPELINAAFLEAPIEEVESMATAVAAAGDAIRAIDELLGAQLGPQAPDLQPLVSVLTAQSRELTERLSARGSTAFAAESGDDDAAVSGDGDVPAAGGGAAAAATPGTVNSRADVVRMLDRICDYYSRQEPSSPVPVLLHRARKLVDMTFLDVVRDLVPEGLSQAEMFRGPEEGDES